jgi:hypothetical protein
MKKVILLISIVVFMFSCKKLEYIKGNTTHNEQIANIEYFKDKRTNKCFASFSNGNGLMITCVPCDSLVELQIHDK